jgi:gas vesicle protein
VNPKREEQDTMADKTSGADFLAGFVVGALVGAAAALLFAPQSGEETRALIRDKGIELQERSVEMSEEARRRAQELQEQTAGKASEWQTKVSQAVAEGKTAGTERKEELLTGLNAEEPSSEAPVEA